MSQDPDSPKRGRGSSGAKERGHSKKRAIRAIIPQTPHGACLRDAVRARALDLGLLGWVRDTDDGRLAVHAEGPDAAVEALITFLRERTAGARAATTPGAHADAAAAGPADVTVEEVPVEGHEQFSVRGVSAGEFVVQEHMATAHHFDLRLQVGEIMRSWAVPKGPSMDPAVKRLAVQVEDHGLDHNAFEGLTDNGGVVVWDRGNYERGGRVPWPEALERGHAVFVLHGEKLHGGFALQRTRPGAKPQWLLLKRRDEEARPGSDVVSEQAASVLSGRTLEELLREKG
jgi:DNA ligase D-like protein (predicted 3'-phosphoesterase)